MVVIRTPAHHRPPATSMTAVSLHFLTKRCVGAATKNRRPMSAGRLQAMVKLVDLGLRHIGEEESFLKRKKQK
ncbi:unnamed protein product [Citrullus colocynthis]|uniref:Uncharacterized protein n=1 Tax=Citrullus colocynthis TaxID=252529 RepID=A0ABP0ZGV4_9ROSI